MVRSIIFSNHSVAGHQTRRAVILVCVVGEIDGPIEITASSSSAHAPNIANGTDCAQALAELRRKGIKIKDVQFKPRGEGSPNFIIYTLQG